METHRGEVSREEQEVCAWGEEQSQWSPGMVQVCVLPLSHTSMNSLRAFSMSPQKGEFKAGNTPSSPQFK